jgi:hypothetical protein
LQGSRNNDDKLIYNRLRGKLHNALTNAKNKTFENYIASLSKDDHTTLKATKKLKIPQISIPPIRNEDESWGERLGEGFTPLYNREIEIFMKYNVKYRYQ